MAWTKKKQMLQLMISGIGFLTSFCFLHTNMHHLYYREWEEKWTYLVLERWRWWRCRVLCFTVSSASVRFASVSPALPYSSSFSSLDLLTVSFFFFSLLLSLCFLSISFSLLFFWCSSSSGFYSQRTPAILVSRRPSRWRGISAAIPALLNREYFP